MSAPEGLNESGYYSMNSTEESSLEIEVIPAPKENIAGHFGPQLIQGGNRGSYWGASIRSCQLLVPDPNHQFHPVEPFFFYHVITNVIPNSNMDKLHARIGFLFEEISGTPTYEMDGNTLAEKLEECRERMENRGSSANFKFHEICENEEGVYYFVQFKSDGTGTLADIDVRESQGKCANAETDDDGHIVECVRLLTSDRVVIMRPAYTKDGQSYYIFSDNGDSIKVRGYLKVEDELMGYMFPMYIYNGIYTGKGSHVSSLQSGDSVNPLVIKLPFNEEDNEKVIAAERTVVDIRDGNATEQNIDEDHKVIHQPDPGMFFLKRVEGGSIVLQTTKDKSLFLGIDEDGTLKTIRPADHYTNDRRLHFKRLLRAQLIQNRMLEIVHETNV